MGFPPPGYMGFSPDVENPAQTPYIFMEKLGGISLEQAISEGLGRENMIRCLDGLAKVRLTLREEPFCEVASLTCSTWGSTSWCNAALINFYTDITDPGQWRSRTYESSLEYFMAQHALSAVLGRHKDSDIKLEMEQRWMIQSYIGFILPLYVQPDIIYKRDPKYGD